MNSVLKLSDQQFLSLFDLKTVCDSLAQNNVRAAKFHLLDHYADRVKTGWLVPPRTITDLRINLDELADNELFELADSILEYHVSPEGTQPAINSDGSIDWCHNPISSREWILRLNRHQWWPILGIAYLKSGDERYAKTFVHQLVDWITKNIPPQRSEEKSSTWRLMEVALRLRVSWIPSFGLFYASPEFTDEAKILMLRSIYDHARFLSYFKTTRNHLLRECNGLAYASIYYPEFKDTKNWLKIALNRFEKEIKRQINQDGSHIEMSTGYQWLAVDEFEAMHQLLKAHNLSLPNENLGAFLEKMYSMLAYVARPDGTFPEINDGFIRWSSRRLAQAGKIFDRDDMVYIGTAGEKGSAPRKTSLGFHDAGLYVMRSNWTKGASYLIFDAGPYGGHHGHEDKLSIELYAYGQTFIVDSGSYTYDRKDPYRNYFVGSQGHNTILVDGLSQIRRWNRINMNPKPVKGNYAIWISRPSFDYVSSTYNDGYGQFSLKKPKDPLIIRDVTHTRKILFVKPHYWICVDELHATHNHEYQLLYHISPDLDVRVEKKANVLIEHPSNSPSLQLIPVDSKNVFVELVNGSETPIQGWHSLDHHHKTASTTVIYKQTNTSSTLFATLLFPAEQRWTLDGVMLERLEVNENRGIAFVVESNLGKDHVMFSNNTQLKMFGAYENKGRVALIRTDRNDDIVLEFNDLKS
jgi:uncharacterized heparinase superfamily protein